MYMYISQVVRCPTHLTTNFMEKISNVKVQKDRLLCFNHLTISFTIDINFPIHQVNHSMCEFLIYWNFSICFNSSGVKMIWSFIKTYFSSYLILCSFSKVLSLAREPPQMVWSLCSSWLLNVYQDFAYATHPTANFMRRMTAKLQAEIIKAKSACTNKLVRGCLQTIFFKNSVIVTFWGEEG